MPNNPQQGGFFTRYAGQNMSPIPAGYMESAAQEAAMYSNIGSTIANMYMKKQEMGIKEQEIAAEKESTAAKVKANELTGARIDAGDRKLEFDAWKTETEMGLKADEQRFRTFTDADKILDNRYQTLNLKLSDAKDQKTKDAIVAEMNSISDQRGVIATGVSRYLKSGTFSEKPASAPPSVRTKRGALGAEYDSTQAWGPLGTREQYIQRGLNAPKRNPNSAPSATNGAEGGEGEYPVAPISQEEANLQFPQTTVPENEPPKVVDGRPATIVAGKPDIFIGHFNTEVKRSTAITNAEGTSLVGEFEYVPSENRAFPGIVSLTVNDNLTSPENAQLTPENLLENQKTFRQMHVLKFILENNFDSGVIPTKQQALSANKKFNADKSPIIGRIQSAFALFDNDDAGRNNEVNLRFNEAFKKRFGMSVDKFMLDGDIPDATVGVRTQSRLPKLVEERNKLLQTISDATVDSLPETYSKDPTEKDRTALLAQIKKDNELFLKLSPGVDTDAYKTLGDRIARARAEHDSLVKESDAWRQSKENWVTQNKYGSDALRGKLANLNATIEGMQASDKFVRESAQSFGLASRTWIGARPEDSKILSGWLAKNIVNFPRTIVPDAKGRMITVNPSEYLDWVVATKSYADFEEVNAAVGAPTQKDFEEALSTNAEHQKLVGPLNALINEWKRTGESDVPQAIIDKFFRPETAAQENNVFAIMAALRKPVTGGGNPSNFEQQMLLSGIPNPGTVFTFSDFNIHRLKTTALLSMLSHARMMQNHGFAITDEALASYNAQYSKIFGRRITMADFNKYQRFVNDRKGAYEGRAGAMTPEEAKAMGMSGYNELTDIVTRDFK